MLEVATHQPHRENSPSRSLPGMQTRVRFVEVAALLASAQDLAFGQPAGSQLRACLVARWLAEQALLSQADTAAVHWSALFRFLGCTGHAHESAVVFGDEIALRARSLQWDSANPGDVLREIVSHAGEPRSGVGRLATVLSALAGGRKAVASQFRAGCEVADALAQRLGLSDDVRGCLETTFERWNGQGFPQGRKGTATPVPMRVVQLAQELEVLARVHGVEGGLAVVRKRSGRAYDPDLVALLDGVAPLLEWLDAIDPWDEVLALDPDVHRSLAGPQLDEALTVVADFADLKSPYTAGHSRSVAQLAADAGSAVGLGTEEVTDLRRAGLVHDLGRVSVSNLVWDKPGPLTRDERDVVQTHALRSEQLLGRCQPLTELASLAGHHHERADGSGYHRGLPGGRTSHLARLLATADAYAAMTQSRAFREAREPAVAAAELQAMAGTGSLDADSVTAVLTAAGHATARTRKAHPAGLSAREVEVLRLISLGLTTKQVGERLVISPKTADRHVQNLYGKIGVSTRGAAALWAAEHGLAR
jgi:HD-GYP domain-containing protein (c-di-GMP phosphodiesterase class II)